ncbi:MAG: ATP-binding cassette domain-containing protein [Gammaproteobacteria bacterium]|nr:ATP-binding cassette domain-containing protein [Gammaproteobacteria bacterium]
MSSVALKSVGMDFPGGFELFKNLNARFDDKAINFVVGRSGVGKTTLLQIIAGLLPPSRGKVFVNDINVTGFNRSEMLRYRKYVGVVTQNSSLVLDRSVYENVAMPLRITGMSGQDIRHRVGASLRVVGMSDASNLLPTRLSSGERQRVSIARAIVHRPKLLVADEPTGNFDRELALEVLGLFDLFAERDTVVVVATHDPNLVSHAERVFELENGTIESLSRKQSSMESAE